MLESGKIYHSTCVEEHIVMIREPDEYYLRRYSNENGKGSSIADGIYSVIKGTDFEENLTVTGTDDAATMTGINEGCTVFPATSRSKFRGFSASRLFFF